MRVVQAMVDCCLRSLRNKEPVLHSFCFVVFCLLLSILVAAVPVFSWKRTGGQTRSACFVVHPGFPCLAADLKQVENDASNQGHWRFCQSAQLCVPSL